MTIKENKFLLFLFFFLLHLIFQFSKIPLEYAYGGDGHSKLIQSVSLFENSFQSENILYPGSDLDPEFHFYPSWFLIRNGESHLGVFPVFFSFLNALLLFIMKPKFLILPWFLLLFVTLRILASTREGLRLESLILLSAGTPFFFSGFEFTEHPLIFFLQILSIYFYFRPSKRNYFLSGFFLLSIVFLRLEVLFFVFYFSIFVCVVRYRFNLLLFLKEEKYFLIGSLIPIFLFLIYNQIQYSHPLGTRYLANEAIFQTGWIHRTIRVITLLFGWKFKLGYFGFSFFFLLSIIYFLKPTKFQLLEEIDKIYLLTILFFIPTITLLAPNDGAVNWGSRYINLAIVPNIFLVNRWIGLNWNRNRFKILVFGLGIVSYLFLNMGIQFLKGAAGQLKLVNREIYSVSCDIRIFPTYYLPLYSGLDYFQSVILVVNEPKKLKELNSTLSNVNSSSEICLVDLTHTFKAISGLLPEKKQKSDESIFDLAEDSNRQVGVSPDSQFEDLLFQTLEENLEKKHVESGTIIETRFYKKKE